MAQKKAADVDAWLRRPDPAQTVVLIYGPDRGLVSERAQTFASGCGVDLSDPFSTVRLDGSELEASPGRLLDETQTVPMFSARRLVWIKGAGANKQLADEVKLIAARPPSDAIVLIEAGDLKKNTALRSNVEEASTAMALPCYADETRSVDSVMDEMFARAGIGISPDARQLLRSNLGGDRLATRAELEKLMLYCRGLKTIDIDDVRNAIGDTASLSLDEAIDAVLSANAVAFEAAYRRLMAAGTHPSQILGAAMRQYQALQSLRSQMDSSGKSASIVVAAARPTVFYSRRKLVEDALQRHDGSSLARALDRLQGANLQTRRRPALAEAAARQALIALLVGASRSRPARRPS